jgi:hypothetical protein
MADAHDAGSTLRERSTSARQPCNGRRYLQPRSGLGAVQVVWAAAWRLSHLNMETRSRQGGKEKAHADHARPTGRNRLYGRLSKRMIWQPDLIDAQESLLELG